MTYPERQHHYFKFESSSFHHEQFLQYVRQNHEQLAEYQTENAEEQPGCVSTMAILHSLYGENLSRLKVLDVGCGQNAPIDRILKKKGVSLIGSDPNPGSFERFQAEEMGHPKRQPIPPELDFPIYQTTQEATTEQRPFDVAISIRLFGFPLLVKDGEKAEYSKAQGDNYVAWLRHFDREATKEEYLHRLEEMTQSVKEQGGILIIVFQPNKDFTIPDEGSIWDQMISQNDLTKFGLELIKNRSQNKKDASEIQNIDASIIDDYQETVILKKV